MSQYTKRFLTSTALFLSFAGTWLTLAIAQEAINVYGPGGPAPAMQEAAKAFGTAITILLGCSLRAPRWRNRAHRRVCALQAISVTALGRPAWRRAMMGVMRAGIR